MRVLLNTHEVLFDEFAGTARTPDNGRALLQAMRDGVNAALQAHTTLMASHRSPKPPPGTAPAPMPVQ